VDADMSDVLSFLNTYYNLTEEDYSKVRKIIVEMGVNHVEKFFGHKD
jgi:hypothetical protein